MNVAETEYIKYSVAKGPQQLEGLQMGVARRLRNSEIIEYNGDQISAIFYICIYHHEKEEIIESVVSGVHPVSYQHIFDFTVPFPARIQLLTIIDTAAPLTKALLPFW